VTEPGPRLPSLDLLRQMTDRVVLEQLIEHEMLSRAEIATRTGLSKPTVSESIRRVAASGLVVEVGLQHGRRGRAGTNLQLGQDVGCAVSVHAGPDGVVAERRDVRGRLLAESRHEVAAPIAAGRLTTLLRTAVRQVLAGADAPVLATTISAADPVDQQTGRLVELPDSPFLTGELAPAEVLADLVEHPPTVDNDVNWAAVAEQRHGVATDLSEFVYCYLGAGLGLGLIGRGQVLHGHRGLAGEIAHVLTHGPDGQARRLVQCFADWGLARPGTAAIDVPAVNRILDGNTPADRRRRDEVVVALAAALSSLTALLNPQVVVLGGPWGVHPGLSPRLAGALADAPVPAAVRIAATGPEAPLIGARVTALDQARARLPTLVGG
jgi:predicted NBD/HSP70 family sugar kinase